MSYLTGLVACDVARMTGFAIHCRPIMGCEEEAVDPEAASRAILRGAWRDGDVVMDVGRMEWWDQWRVVWCLIGGNAYCTLSVRLQNATDTDERTTYDGAA